MNEPLPEEITASLLRSSSEAMREYHRHGDARLESLPFRGTAQYALSNHLDIWECIQRMLDGYQTGLKVADLPESIMMMVENHVNSLQELWDKEDAEKKGNS